MMIHSSIIRTPFGSLAIDAEDEYVIQLRYLPANIPLNTSTHALLIEVEKQLQRYFDHPGYQFHLPLKPAGSIFQQRVWRAISDIPSGNTQTYGEIAKKLDSGARAVGQACGSNPFPLIIPCHRVVSANGLGGFAHSRTEGYLLAAKRWLLAHENNNA